MALKPLSLVAGAAVLVELALSLFVVPHGHLTWDAGTYHLAVKAFAETGSFAVDNGFSELPSPELAVGQLRIHGQWLFSQYPEGFTLLATPFYLALGFRGLFLLSALSFVATAFLVHALAKELLGDLRAARAAALVYALGTFAFEYSHWPYPHAASTALVTLSLYLAARGAIRDDARFAAAGAFVLGAAASVRVDAVLAFPALGYLALCSSDRIKRASGVALGAALGLLLPMALNHLKFGFAAPATYARPEGLNTNAGYYGSLAALLAFLLVAVGVAWSVRTRFGPLRTASGFGALTALGLVLVPSWLEDVGRLVYGTVTLLGDLRLKDPYPPEAGISRSASGAVIYAGALKKALTQSLPYWPAVLAVTLSGALAHRRRALVFLWLVPLAHLLFFGYDSWHGSVALNLRYFTAALPAIAVLTAMAYCALTPPGNDFKALALFLGALMATWLACRALPALGPVAELVLLRAPLAAAAALALAALLALRRPRAAPLVAAGLVASAGFAGGVNVGYDLPASTALQARNLRVGSALAPYVAPDALVFSDFPDLLWTLLDRVAGLRLARPQADAHQSFDALIDAQLARGRPVYLAYETVAAAFPAHHQRRYSAYEIRELTRVPSGTERWFVLFELERRAGASHE